MTFGNLLTSLQMFYVGCRFLCMQITFHNATYCCSPQVHKLTLSSFGNLKLTTLNVTNTSDNKSFPGCYYNT